MAPGGLGVFLRTWPTCVNACRPTGEARRDSLSRRSFPITEPAKADHDASPVPLRCRCRRRRHRRPGDGMCAGGCAGAGGRHRPGRPGPVRSAAGNRAISAPGPSQRAPSGCSRCWACGRSCASTPRPLQRSTSPTPASTTPSARSSFPTTTASRWTSRRPTSWKANDCNAALLTAAQARGSIALLGGHAITGFAIDEHGCSVDLEGGTPLRTPLLVAADGRASRLREMAGIKIVGWSYPQVGIVTTVGTRSRIAAGPCSISCPPVRSRSCRSAATGPASPGRRRRSAAGPSLLWMTRASLPRCDKRFGYRLGDVEADRPARQLAARHASGPRIRDQPVRARGRRGARRAPDRRPGPQPGPAGRGGARPRWWPIRRGSASTSAR